MDTLNIVPRNVPEEVHTLHQNAGEKSHENGHNCDRSLTIGSNVAYPEHPFVLIPLASGLKF